MKDVHISLGRLTLPVNFLGQPFLLVFGPRKIYLRLMLSRKWLMILNPRDVCARKGHSVRKAGVGGEVCARKGHSVRKAGVGSRL